MGPGKPGREADRLPLEFSIRKDVMVMLRDLGLFLAAEKEIVNQLPVPPIVFGLAAMAIFVVVTLVFWSFRDVATRHSEKAEQYAREHGEASH